MVLGVAYILNDGFVSENLISKTRPNEGIRQSFINAARFSLLFGTLFGVVLGMAFGVFWSIRFKGGIPFLWHVALREVLWKHGYAPYNYARFLDYCIRLRLLVRVGGSYKFMHRLLQEHFAAEYAASLTETEISP
jgi:hypothetical protein